MLSVIIPSCPEAFNDDYGFLPPEDPPAETAVPQQGPRQRIAEVPQAWVQWKKDYDRNLESNERLNQWIIDAFISSNSEDSEPRSKNNPVLNRFTANGLSPLIQSGLTDPHRPRRFSVSTIGSASSLIYSGATSSISDSAGSTIITGDEDEDDDDDDDNSDETTVETVSTEMDGMDDAETQASFTRVGECVGQKHCQPRVWYVDEGESIADKHSLPYPNIKEDEKERIRQRGSQWPSTGYSRRHSAAKLPRQQEESTIFEPPSTRAPPLPRKRSTTPLRRSAEDLANHLTPNQDFINARVKQRNRTHIPREIPRKGSESKRADEMASTRIPQTQANGGNMQNIMRKILDDVSIAGDG